MTCSYKDVDVIVDITHINDQHKGIECIQLVKSYLHQYPQLKPILLVLKNLLKLHKLNDPYSGGLSSYGLLLLIVGYFQHVQV